MEHEEKKCTQAGERKETPGQQGSTYQDATPETVKQDVKELNNIGAPGKEY